jgi:putative transposase
VSQTISPSTSRPYGLALSCRALEIARSTVYAIKAREATSPRPPEKRGPKTEWSDAELTERIREAIASSPWLGEGYRQVWARLRPAGIRTRKRRVLRLMREAGLLAPTRVGRAHGPKAHDGTITTERPDEMWGSDATGCLTDEGHATIFVAVDHCTQECTGIHAARRGTRFEALEPIRQGVRERFGGYAEEVAAGLALRHDHGSQFTTMAASSPRTTTRTSSPSSASRAAPPTSASRKGTGSRKDSFARSRSSSSGSAASPASTSWGQRSKPSRTATTASGWLRSTAISPRQRPGRR